MTEAANYGRVIAVLGYTDPANGLPATRIIASGVDVPSVFDAAMPVYTALLNDRLGIGRTVGGGNRDQHRLDVLDELRLGIYLDRGEGERQLCLKVGGEQYGY